MNGTKVIAVTMTGFLLSLTSSFAAPASAQTPGGKKVLSDAEKYHSTAMNEKAAESEIKNGDGIKVAFLGNSITIHQKSPSIGWHNVWGMAASAKEKDYVHIVIREIEKQTGRKVNAKVRGLANFERNFLNYNYSADQDIIDFKPDILVLAIGENVPELGDEASKLAYRDAVRKLLEGFMQGKNPPTVVVRGVFWPNAWKDRMMKEAAEACGAKFVKADFGRDKSMMALGLFEHRGVQVHPGDKGMNAIAQSIINALFPN